MNLEIHSHVGVGPINFGMTMEEVRSIVPCPYDEFSRFGKKLTDAFHALGLFVGYSLEGKCEAIEMASPAQPVYAGQKLLSSPPEQVLKFVRDLDPKTLADNSGLTSFALGIGFYVPGTRHGDLDIETVIAFRRGYYDDLPFMKQ